ncbi:Protein of unknown function [Solimonas aquatica]|uniref:Ribosome association toxin RatA n=1 Tax=Solimonas aquatica TaxID=489703 RepID=A0A1H9HXC7_9GAMM|nr:DUF2505 domain-containing protein [Solimonas aquatica]SEQ66968.1 Protein of unknown function [Solimonas aquatica]
MQHEERQSFDAAPEVVMRMFGDRRYFERKYAALGFTRIEVLEHESQGSRFRIKVRYDTSNDIELPDFARKFLPEVVTVVQQDSWNLDSRKGQLQFELKTVPIKIGAQMELQAQGAGCVNLIRWDLSCGLPLIGGKLERLLLSDIQSKSKADLAASRRILRDYIDN